MYSNNKKTNVGFPLNVVEVTPDVDFKYGPYTSVDAALNALGENGSDCICAGLAFGVTQTDGSIKEYKFKKGIANASDLICEEDLIEGLQSSIDDITSTESEDVELEYGTGILPFVQYSPQNLTTEQKAQVLINLGLEIASSKDITDILN